MKTKYKLAIGLATVMLAGVLIMGCGSGCATGGGDTSIVGTSTNGMLFVFGQPVSTNQFQTSMQVAGVAAATIALKADTNSVVYLQLVAQSLEAAVATGATTPAELQASITELGVKDVSVTVGITAGITLYGTFFQSAVDQKIGTWSLYAVPGITGFAQGILSITH
jgi:hypothetical protein